MNWLLVYLAWKLASDLRDFTQQLAVVLWPCAEKSHLCFTVLEKLELSSCSVMKRSQITMRLVPCKSEYLGVFSILRGFGEQKTWRKCLPFATKQEWEHFWILCFYFFSGLHYQLGISLFTDTRSSCIRCYEGISWTICIIWCHWGVSCSRWISSRAIYWSVSHKIQKTAVCKVLDRAISLHLLYLKCVKFVESWE